MREIVLPSGRFATLRRITWFDRVASSSPTTEIMVMAIACRITKIDGEPLTWPQAQEMDLIEAAPIINAVCEDLIAACKAKGIA